MKTFVGPRLRRLRRDKGQTQAEMGRALGISTSYVNLLEKNERSVSVAVLLKLFEVYGVDWRDIADDEQSNRLPDLRAALLDPLFDQSRPDIAQLRAALTHCPDFAESFLNLTAAYQALTERMLSGGEAAGDMIASSPEARVHAFFRRRDNYFEELETAAGALFAADPPAPDELYARVKADLRDRFGVETRIRPAADLPHTLRHYDARRGRIDLSEALDHPNRIFQMLHVQCLAGNAALLDDLIAQSGIEEEQGKVRCRVELANYYAAAAMMPYERFLAEARASKYDLNHLATRFGVSFEQACHRAVTLRRPGAAGAPLFFLRIDHAGNVTKRFNSTDFTLAEYGGACPRLEVHTCFRTPGRIVPQLVEMPDASQYLVFSRTVDRPSFTRHSQDRRLAVAIGCAAEHAAAFGYADELNLPAARATEIGINCRVCPRNHCDQRAQQGVALIAPVDAHRRGATRYES